MALSSQSLILYGYSVDVSNCNIDFQSSSGGPVLTAVVALGAYSLTSLLTAVVAALNAADPSNTYTSNADRTLMGGTQNRVTISTNGVFLSLLFGTGPNTSTSIASLIGFNPTNYTGLTSYIGAQTTGTVLIPQYYGYSYSDPTLQSKVFGAVNVSAAGVKEAVVFNIQQFVEVQFKYESKANATTAWNSFFLWAIKQQPFDFTPQITQPSTFYPVTLEQTEAEANGLAYKMPEMLPEFPNFYQTGMLKFRVVLNYSVQTFSFGG